MATYETVEMVGGPLDGQTLEGAFGLVIYLDAGLQVAEPALAYGSGPPDVAPCRHRYRRGLPTYEFEYQGYH